jgi:glycosyltransferase involved in cell wall biosynthesis
VSRPALTVLTTPVIPAALRAYAKLRGIGRQILKPGTPGLSGSRYPGHYAVTRSVVEGLRAIGADFNFNPSSFSQLGRIVYAPANEALLQAAALKQRGAVEFLVAGPVNAFFADECDGIMQLPAIDLAIVAAEWMIDFYRDVPSLARKSRAVPCGVDAEFWKPASVRKDRTAVVYWKSGDERFCEQVEAIVRRAGLEPLRVRSRHGEHAIFTPDHLRAQLDRAILSVFLSTFESQGIALAEAWSMNVPTVVWDPQGDAEWRGRHFKSASSAPYLTPATGIATRDVAGLEGAIAQALATLETFHPREWVLGNMTDAVCSRKLYELIMREAGKAPIRTSI